METKQVVEKSKVPTAVMVILGAIIIQVFVPVLFDLVITIVIGGACGWLGYMMGRARS